MKKRALSLFCALTMALSLTSFITVSAAELGTPSFELVYDATSQAESGYALLYGYYKGFTGLGITKSGVPPTNNGYGICDTEIHIPIDYKALGIEDPTAIIVSDTNSFTEEKGPFAANFAESKTNAGQYEIVVAVQKIQLASTTQIKIVSYLNVGYLCRKMAVYIRLNQPK